MTNNYFILQPKNDDDDIDDDDDVDDGNYIDNQE